VDGEGDPPMPKVYTTLSKDQEQALEDIKRYAKLASDAEALRFTIAFTSAVLGTRVKLLSPEMIAEAMAKAWTEVMRERRK